MFFVLRVICGRGQQERFLSHLEAHDPAEVVYEGGTDGGDVDGGGKLGGHGGDWAVGDAAGDYVAVPGEVGVDVEGEAMEGDAAAYLDAYGGYLASGGPNSGEARLDVGSDVEVGEGVDDDLLDGADVLQGADAQPAQVEDGVSDELAGAVVGDLAATVSLVDGNAEGGELGVCGQQMLVAAEAAAGVDVRVFEEEKSVGGESVVDAIYELVLQLASAEVFDGAEPRVAADRQTVTPSP